MVGFEAILGAMDMTLQLRITKIPQGVEASDEPVEFEKRPPGPVMARVGAELADERALGHLLESQRGDDLVEMGLLRRDQ